MAQIKEEKINDTSLNGPNANHKQKDEFHGGGRGGRGNRFQPYGGPNRDRKGGPPRDNNMVSIKVVLKCFEFSIYFFFYARYYIHTCDRFEECGCFL